MRFVTAMVLGTAMLIGSAAMAATKANKAKPAKQITLTEKDNGGRIQLKKGQKLVLSLAQNPTTGYRWRVVSTTKSFGYPAEKYAASGPKGIIGGGGTLKLTWDTKSPFASPGMHSVKLAYGRSWEKKAIKTFSFSVQLKK